MKESLASRDQARLNILHYCNESLRLMTQEQINIRSTMDSLSKRHYELTKENEEILNWAMKTMLGKKKVPLPHIRILDYVPYNMEPKDAEDVFIPFSQPNEPLKIQKTPTPKPARESSKSLIEPKKKK